MANKRIFADLTELTTAAADDVLPIVDDTGIGGTPTTKKISVSNLMAQAPQGDLEAANNLSDLNDAATARTNLGLGTAATSASTDFFPSSYSTQTYTASGTPLAFTLTSAAKNKVVTVNETSNVYVTVPTGLGAGFNCTFVQLGTGKIIVQAGSGAVVGAYTVGTSSYNTTAGQYAGLHLVPTSTDNYVVFGETVPSPFVNTYSILLGGTNEWVDLGTSSTLNGATQFTVSWWQKTSTSGRVIFSGDSSNRVQTLTTGVQVRIPGGSTTIATVGSTNFANGAWNQLTLTYNAGTVTLYANGNSTPDGSNSNFATSIGSTAYNNFILGQVANLYYFNGYLDEVAVWSTALSASEIPDIQASGAPIDLSSDNGNYTSSANLAHYYRGGDNNSGQGTTMTDAAGTLDGTLINGAAFDTEAP